MKMYSITVKDTSSSSALPALMVTLVLSLKLDRVEVICSETDDRTWGCSTIILPRDVDILYNAFVLLTHDTGFFTMSCKERALIIPFEGPHFNIIVNDDVETLPPVDGLIIRDSTAVLLHYQDAYEGYGMSATFPHINPETD